jgi:hypothetical protein
MNRIGLILKIIGTVILAFIALGVLAASFILNSRTQQEIERSSKPESSEIVTKEPNSESDGQTVEPVEIVEDETQNNEFEIVKAETKTNSESAKESKKPYTSGLFPLLGFNYPVTWKTIETNAPSEDYEGIKEYTLEVTNDRSSLKFRFLPSVIARCGGTSEGLQKGIEINDIFTEFPNGKGVTYGVVPVCPTGFLTNSTLPIDSNAAYATSINEALFLEPEFKKNVFYDVYIDATFDTDEDKERIRDIIRSAKF